MLRSTEIHPTFYGLFQRASWVILSGTTDWSSWQLTKSESGSKRDFSLDRFRSRVAFVASLVYERKRFAARSLARSFSLSRFFSRHAQFGRKRFAAMTIARSLSPLRCVPILSAAPVLAKTALNTHGLEQPNVSRRVSRKALEGKHQPLSENRETFNFALPRFLSNPYPCDLNPNGG